MRLLGDEAILVHPPMLRSEGVVITRVGNHESAVETAAEGVVIEQVFVHSSTETNRAVYVVEGSATVTGCDLMGTVGVGGRKAAAEGLRRPRLQQERRVRDGHRDHPGLHNPGRTAERAPGGPRPR